MSFTITNWWQWQTMSFDHCKWCVAITKHVGVFIKCIDVIPLTAFIESEFKPFYIFGIFTERYARKFPILLYDTQRVFLWSHFRIIPWQVTVVRQYGQFLVGCVAEQAALIPCVLFNGEPAAIPHAIRAYVCADTKLLIAQFVKLGHSLKIFYKLLVHIFYVVSANLQQKSAKIRLT